MTKEARTYNGEKTDFSVNGAGKTEQLHEKNEIKTLSNTIHTHKKKKRRHFLWWPKWEGNLQKSGYIYITYSLYCTPETNTS